LYKHSTAEQFASWEMYIDYTLWPHKT